MANENTDEPLSNISDSSFVILGQGSLPSIFDDVSPKISTNNGPLINGANFGADRGQLINGADSLHFDINKMTRRESSKNPAESSLFENDTQAKLNQLLKENYQLKETLNQNNLAIKSQLDTFVMWQQEVLKTHETHKQKFLETKELILKLKAENGNLKEQLMDSLRRSSIPDGYSEVLESTDSGFVKPNHLKDEIDGLKQKISNYECMCNDVIAKNEKLITENSQLKDMLRETKNDFLKVSKELENALMENTCLKEVKSQSPRTFESFNHSSLPNADARAQISNLFKQLEEEREKVKGLKKELEDVKSKSLIGMDPNLNTTEELSEYINKLDDMSASFDKQSQRFNTINSWVSLAEENFKSLKSDKVDKGVDCVILSEIEQFKTHLHEKENAFKEKQESLQEIQQQFQKLLKDYEELQEKLNSFESNKTNLEECRNEISRLNEQLESKSEALLCKEQECDKLKEDIKKITSECKDVDVWKLQVELYQSDFNDERAAREKVVGEKEEMAEQIRLLESKIKDLEQKKAQKTEATPESTSASNKEKKSRYVCPKCLFSFSDLNRCQTHIDECLDIAFYP